MLLDIRIRRGMVLGFVVALAVLLHKWGAGSGPGQVCASDAGTAVGGPITAPRRLRLVSAEKEHELRQALPRVDNESIQAILDDPYLIFYTDDEIPPAYQIWDGQLQGIHSPRYNISADGGEPHGNGNREFPWNRPAGAHNSPQVTAFRFLRLPRDTEGRIWPVVWWRQLLSGDTSQSYCWAFPVGTVFGEVLRLRSPEGEGITFELRLRFREEGTWEVDVYRPFPTREDLLARIQELRPDWPNRGRLVKLVRHLEGNDPMPVRTLSNRHPGRTVFRQSMGVDVLPSAGDDALIEELLKSTPFQSASGKTWREDSNGTITYAPTTKAPFHIVPTDFAGGYLQVDSVSCARCHDTVNEHVDHFDFTRDWYGHVRGADGIFSFHPFDPSVISYNGYFSGGVRMRNSLVKFGILERFNRDKHPRSIYHNLSPGRR